MNTLNIQHYVNQLIDDLEKVAAHPPDPAYIEIPPHLEEMPDIAEVALVPFKTIQELTGIDEEAFPTVGYLTYDQMEMINTAIFKVFDSLHIELIDKPEVIPPDNLYEALTLNWGMYVQYLPSSGYDLELCTQDIESCLYGEFCEYCNDQEYEEYDEMPPESQHCRSVDELPF